MTSLISNSLEIINAVGVYDTKEHRGESYITIQSSDKGIPADIIFVPWAVFHRLRTYCAQAGIPSAVCQISEHKKRDTLFLNGVVLHEASTTDEHKKS